MREDVEFKNNEDELKDIFLRQIFKTMKLRKRRVKRKKKEEINSKINCLHGEEKVVALTFCSWVTIVTALYTVSCGFDSNLGLLMACSDEKEIVNSTAGGGGSEHPSSF